MASSIAKSLAKFHALMGPIEKDASNPFFSSKYASLGNILASIKEPLQKAGLVFTQLPQADGSLQTAIYDIESGEHIIGTMKVTPVKNDPQALGSAISYARRYSLVAILGLDTDSDDDGNEATTSVAGAPPVRLPPPSANVTNMTPTPGARLAFAPCVTPGCTNKANIKYGKTCYPCSVKAKGRPAVKKVEAAVPVAEAFVAPTEDLEIPF